MTINDLIEQLLQLADDHGDVEVRLATQPGWPLESGIGCVTVDTEPRWQEDGSDADLPAVEPVVYITEGRQLGYLPHSAAVQAGWRS